LGISPFPESVINISQKNRLVKPFILGYDMHMKVEQITAKLLKQRYKTIAIAESCTGGLLCHKLTNIPGSSGYFKLGTIAYANESKIKMLKIPAKTIQAKGAVSKEVALLMAQNIRKIAKSDFGIGITGIAGPTGATAKKPVGLVYIAVASNKKTILKKFNFKGSRINIKNQAATLALKLLNKFQNSTLMAGSSPIVGSSKIIISGSCNKEQATATLR